MRITKAQRRLLYVLGGVVAIFATDTLLLKPAGVSAAVVDGGVASAGAGAVASDVAVEADADDRMAEEAAATSPLVRKLEELAEQPFVKRVTSGELSGLFGPMRDGGGVAGVAAEREDVVSERLPEVSSVVVGRRPAAIVDGRVVRVGSRVDGFVVTGIDGSGVTVREDGTGGVRRLRLGGGG